MEENIFLLCFSSLIPPMKIVQVISDMKVPETMVGTYFANNRDDYRVDSLTRYYSATALLMYNDILSG